MTDDERVKVCQAEIRRLRSAIRENREALQNALIIDHQSLFETWADYDDDEAPGEVIRLIENSGMGPVDAVSFNAFCYGYYQGRTENQGGCMKTIAINSIKGGTGKSTISVLFINALTSTGFRCLVIDADASNNSLSFYLNDRETVESGESKTIFNLFMGEKAADCVTRINEKLGLIRGDVRLNEFRSTDSLKRLKRALEGAEYDFCVIDTSPTYDNIIGNVLTASDILLIPVQQDLFSYQALQYQFEKFADLELSNIDTHIVFNQFEKPLTENLNAYRNQITNLFMENETFKPFINPNRLSRSSLFRKYINKRNYRIDGKLETQKAYGEIKALIQSVLGINIGEEI